MKKHRITPDSAGRSDLPAPPSGTSTRGGSDSSSTTDATPTCPQCQATLSGEARFCHLCGAPIAGPGPEAVTAEATELVAAAHHSSPKIIVVDHVQAVEAAVERAATEDPRSASGRDLLATTPYRGLDVQCEDEAVFFTEELEHDKPEDFSDLVGRRPARQPTGLRTTLLIGGAVLATLVVAVWIIERKPTPPKSHAAASMTAEKPRPSRARPALKSPTMVPAMRARSQAMTPPQPVVTPTPVPAPTVAASVVNPAAPSAAPSAAPAAVLPVFPPVVVPPVVTAGAMGSPVTKPVMAAAASAPSPTRRAASPRPSTASASEASVADQLAARASSLVKRNATLAVKLARAALAQKPAHAKARGVLARVYEGQAKKLLYSGANRAAAQSARRALRFGPARTQPLFYLGVALNEQRRRAEATRVLSRFLKRCPSCGYNSMYARQLLTANRRILAAKGQAKAAMTAPPAP